MKETFGQLSLLLLVWFVPFCAAQDLNQQVTDKYVEQIHAITRNKGAVHPDLIEPYQSLSETYFQQKDYVKAGSILNVAIQIRRVNEGLFNQSLIPHLKQLSLIYWLNQQHNQADQLRKNISEIKLYGQDRKGLVAISAHDQLAYWYHTTYRYREARKQLKEITQILRKSLGSDTIKLAPYLIRLAETYRSEQATIDPDLLPEFNAVGSREAKLVYQSTYLSPAIVALKQAKLLYDQSDDDQSSSLAKVSVLLGDLYMASDRPQHASTYYQDANDFLRNGEDYRATHTKFFARPKLIRFPKLSPRTRRITDSDKDVNNRTPMKVRLELSYTVTSRGRLENLKITAAQPPNTVNISRSEITRIARYRPAWSDNQLVDTHDVKHTYSYNVLTGESSSNIVQ